MGKKGKGGRPSKYETEWKYKIPIIEGWARDGLTDEQVAKKIGISTSTLYEWKSKYSEFSESLKNGKDIVDREVENALLQKALGIKERVLRAIKVKEVLYQDGKRVSEKEHIEYATEEVYIPPDTTAQIFWLKNRKPSDWRDKRDIEHSGSLDTGLNKLNSILNQLKE